MWQFGESFEDHEYPEEENVANMNEAGDEPPAAEMGNVVEEAVMDAEAEDRECSLYNGKYITFVVGESQECIIGERKWFPTLKFYSRYFHYGDADPEAFKAVLKYLKTRECNLKNIDQACEIYKIARYLKLATLQKCCTDFFYPRCLEDVWFILLNSIFYKDHLLILACRGIVQENVDKFFGCHLLVNIPAHILSEFMNTSKIYIGHELQIVKAMTNWAKHKCDKAGLDKSYANLKEVLKEALYQIPFAGLSNEELEMHTSDLLTDTQRSVVLAQRDQYLLNISLTMPKLIHFMPQCKELKVRHTATPRDFFTPKFCETRVELFKSTRNMELLSVKLRAQVSNSERPFYNETLDVKVATISGICVYKGHYEGLTRYGEDIEIYMKPVASEKCEFFLKKSSLFIIDITFKSRSGTYPLFKHFLKRRNKAIWSTGTANVICGFRFKKRFKN